MTIAIPGGNDNHVMNAHVDGVQQDKETVIDSDIRERYGVVLLMEETSEDELNDLVKDLPTDTHLVTYRNPNGAVAFDAIRAYKKADLFDYYHDLGCEVLNITAGFGSIRPNLFVDKRKS